MKHKPIRFFYTLFILCLIAISSRVFASGELAGTVTVLKYIGGDVCSISSCVIVKIDGVYTSKPACATSANYMTIDLTTDKGQSQYAAILTAYSKQKQARLYGKGTCDWYDGIEDIKWIDLL